MPALTLTPPTATATRRCTALLRGGTQNVDAADEDGIMPLHFAAEHGHTATMRALLAAGACVDVPNSDGVPPLHWAAGYGNADIVRALLAAGARVDATNSDGFTPLHRAARGGLAATMRALLEARRAALCVPFAMSQHPRLGAGAAAGGLEAGLVREVLALVERGGGAGV